MLSTLAAAAQSDVADFYRSKGLTLRIAALRTAFAQVSKDAAFLDEVRKQNLDLKYVPGGALADMTAKVMASLPGVVERLHKVLGF
jgi:hypothetical protein